MLLLVSVTLLGQSVSAEPTSNANRDLRAQAVATFQLPGALDAAEIAPATLYKPPSFKLPGKPKCDVRTPRECLCSARPACAWPTRCLPTVACGSAGSSTFARDAVLEARAAIVSVLHFSRKTAKACHSSWPANYLRMARQAARLALSLRAVSTRLPMLLLVSGERQPAYESAIAALGVTVLEGDTDAVPDLPTTFRTSELRSSKGARTQSIQGTFAKLHVLSLHTRGYARLIVLDVDCLVLRNIDHLHAAPTPGFAFLGDQMNSGVMVLDPREAATRRAVRAFFARGLVSSPDKVPPRVRATLPHNAWLGDQMVWHEVYDIFHELPIGYNAMPHVAEAGRAAFWLQVHVLHDVTTGLGCSTFPRSAFQPQIAATRDLLLQQSLAVADCATRNTALAGGGHEQSRAAERCVTALLRSPTFNRTDPSRVAQSKWAD